MKNDRKILVGVISGAHGVKGLVRLKSFTEEPEAIQHYKPLCDEKGQREFAIKIKSATNSHFIAEIKGVKDRDEAEALRGTRLFVERAALPKLKKREFYEGDLVGLKAQDAKGKDRGTVIAVHNYGGGPFLEIEPAQGKAFMLPFSDSCVPEVDAKAGHITIAPPERMGVMSWRAAVLTIFPEMFPGPLGASLPGKALKEKLWQLDVVDIRSFATGKHASVDDTPYGGGAGMVMRPDVVDAAIRGAGEKFGKPARKIYLSPRGRRLDQLLVKELAAADSVLLLCGRYEGVDERVIEAQALEEMSLGDFVLAGGELAAMALIEACVRLIPGAVGNADTHAEESFEQGLLEYPHYTKPAMWEGRQVPEVLVSGHHERVKDWRRQQAEEITRQKRPDLWNSRQLLYKGDKEKAS